jgi:hypothetical protein
MVVYGVHCRNAGRLRQRAGFNPFILCACASPCCPRLRFWGDNGGVRRLAATAQPVGACSLVRSAWVC